MAVGHPRQSLVGMLADYLILGAAPPYTEYGVKGISEGGASAPPAAIANAVCDAPDKRVVRRGTPSC
jgi:CO/xanthine dehydrogenase Mo-binding subunit